MRTALNVFWAAALLALCAGGCQAPVDQERVAAEAAAIAKAQVLMELEHAKQEADNAETRGDGQPNTDAVGSPAAPTSDPFARKAGKPPASAYSQRRDLAVAPAESEPADDPRLFGDDLAAAEASSRQTGKPVLLVFDGGDACAKCVLLHRQVFDTPEAQALLADHATPVLIGPDHPDREELKQRFGVGPLPAVFLYRPGANARYRLPADTAVELGTFVEWFRACHTRIFTQRPKFSRRGRDCA